MLAETQLTLGWGSRAMRLYSHLGQEVKGILNPVERCKELRLGNFRQVEWSQSRSAFRKDSVFVKNRECVSCHNTMPLALCCGIGACAGRGESSLLLTSPQYLLVQH